jgi:hypothetical protein
MLHFQENVLESATVSETVALEIVLESATVSETVALEIATG